MARKEKIERKPTGAGGDGGTSKMSGKGTRAMTVREFLVSIAAGELLAGKEYEIRIPIEDGGENSYIGFDADIDDWRHKGKLKSLRLFRQNKWGFQQNKWEFQLGGICNEYHSNPDIPIRFTTFGKTPAEAAEEAAKYYGEVMRLVRKQTSAYKLEQAETEQKEREQLLAKLAELEEQAK